MIKAYK